MLKKDFYGNVTFEAGAGPDAAFVKEYMRLKPLYSGALKTACSKFEILDDEFSMIQGHDPIHSIESRLKTVESAYEKLARRGYEQIPRNLTKLTDIAGVRVICGYIEDVYKISRVFLNQTGIRLLKEKDYIKNPKPNGYRSLHLIVEIPIFLMPEKKFMRVEVQFRTIAMDFWASLEHKLKYKKDIKHDVEQISEELRECAEEISRLDMKMQSIHRKIYGTDGKTENK